MGLERPQNASSPGFTGNATLLQGRILSSAAPAADEIITWNNITGEWVPMAAGIPGAHASTHEDGGGDEIDVTGLSGELADNQPPKDHASAHQNGGGDEINVAALSGELADPQPPKTHAASHTNGSDDIQDATTSQKGLMTTALVQALNNKEPIFNGLVDPSQLGLSYNAATRQMTVTNGGTDVLVGGTRSTPSNETTGAHADTTAAYYFYYTSGATALTVSTTAFDILVHAPIAIVFFNTDMSPDAAIHTEERHSIQFEAIHHYTEHFFHGTKFVTGQQLADYTLQPGSPANSHNQLSIAAGKIADEDIVADITALASAGPYTILYRAGADSANRWDWDTTPTVPVLQGGSYMYWNQLSGGNWTNPASGNGDYVNMWIISVPRLDGGTEALIIMGQAAHSSLADAQEENIGTAIDWGTAPFQEFCPLYRVTFRMTAAYSTTGKCRIEAVQDIRGTTGGGAVAISGSPQQHNALSGRSDAGAHPSTAVTADTTSFAGVLSGADDTVQKALDTIDDAAPLAHASSHQNGGADEISVAGLSGELADPQPPKTHASDHSDGGTDEVNLENLAATSVDVSAALRPDGAGGVSFSDVGHGDLTGVTSDQHHAQAHAASHKDGGSDELDVEEFATAGASGTVPTSQGDGSVSMERGASKVINLNPEYPGAVLYPDGANNDCEIVSGHDQTNHHNYMEISAASNPEDYDVVLEIRVPTGWSWDSGKIYVWTDDHVNNTMAVEIFDTTGTTDGSDTVTPSASNAWQEIALTTPAGTYASEGLFHVHLKGTIGANDKKVRFGAILLKSS